MLYGENDCNLFFSTESRIQLAFTTWTFGFYGTTYGNGNSAKVLHFRVAQVVSYVYVDERGGIKAFHFPSMDSYQLHQL